MKKRLIAASVAAIYWRPSPPQVAGPGWLTATDVAKAVAKLDAARVPVAGRVLWLDGIEYRT